MDEDSRSFVDAALVGVVVPLVEGLDARLRAGIDVADVGCGSGHAINVLAREYPASRFVGFDFSEEAIGRANAEARSMGLTNARFELCDAATLDQPEAFDLVTAFDAVHDQAHPGQVLAAIARATRPGGTFLMIDIKASSNVEDNIENPLAPTLYTFSTMHCMTGVAGPGRGRTRHGMGTRAGHVDAARGRFRGRPGQRARGRPVQRLLRLPQVARAD